MGKIAALATLVLGVLGGGAAFGATYTQYACAGPGGLGAPADGFVATGPGTANDCARRGGLTLAVGGGDGAVAHAAWRYAPPPDTTVAGLVVRHSVRIPGGSAAAYALAGSADACDARSGCGDDVFDLPVPADGLLFGLSCPDSGCGETGATVVLRSLVITLRDDTPPGGRLRLGASAPRGGSVPPAMIDASDTGGGVRRVTLLVDGHPRTARAFCRPPFLRAVPCPPRVHVTLRLPRRGLADGAHSLAAAVQDATGTNIAAIGPVTTAVTGPPSARPGIRRPTLTTPRRRLHNGDLLVLRTRAGSALGRVAFQVRVGSRWRTFAVRRAGLDGRATLRHRLRHTVRSVRYAFRVRSLPGPASAPIRVAVD